MDGRTLSMRLQSNDHTVDCSDEVNCKDENDIDLHKDEMKQETYNDLNYNDGEIKVTR